MNKNTDKIILSREDITEISRINAYHRGLTEAYLLMTNNQYLCNVSKVFGENKGQFGYYPFNGLGEVKVFANLLNLKSFLDLGSGPGLTIKALRGYFKKTQGYEIEPALIEDAKRLGVDVIKKDILELNNKDISGFDCIYFYEPFTDAGLKKKFISRLEKIVSPGQFIFSVYKIRDSKKWSELEIEKAIRIYKVI